MDIDELKKTKIKCNKLIDVALQYKADSEEKDRVIHELQEQLQEISRMPEDDNAPTDIKQLPEETIDDDVEDNADILPEEHLPIEEEVTKPTQEKIDRQHLELDEDVVIVYEKGFFRKIINFLGVIILFIVIAILIIVCVKIIYLEV